MASRGQLEAPGQLEALAPLGPPPSGHQSAGLDGNCPFFKAHTLHSAPGPTHPRCLIYMTRPPP